MDVPLAVPFVRPAVVAVPVTAAVPEYVPGTVP
jgi:hypothetical protein